MMLKHKKLFAVLATAGGLVAASGAAHAIAPAAALGLAALGGAAAGHAAAEAKQEPQHLTMVPASPTVVLGGPAATVVEVTPAPVQTDSSASSTTVVTPNGPINYDHDGDGVLNANDRYPNDGTRS